MKKSIDTQIAIAGSLIQLFIDRGRSHYNQRELTTFYQTALQQTICEVRLFKLILIFSLLKCRVVSGRC